MQRQKPHLRSHPLPHAAALSRQTPSLADAATAIQMLQARHISYLNAEQTESTLTSWKSQTYTSSNAYNGLTLYDYMTTHLGYRYVLRDAALSFNTWKNESGSLTLSIENVGFSVSYHAI